jgi:hypothetical protein
MKTPLADAVAGGIRRAGAKEVASDPELAASIGLPTPSVADRLWEQEHAKAIGRIIFDGRQIVGFCLRCGKPILVGAPVKPDEAPISTDPYHTCSCWGNIMVGRGNR